MAQPTELTFSFETLFAYQNSLSSLSPTMGQLLEEIINLREMDVIKNHQKACQVLDRVFEKVCGLNGIQILEESQCKFYNLIQHLLNPKGEINEWCLDRLENIPFETTDLTLKIQANDFEAIIKIIDRLKYLSNCHANQHHRSIGLVAVADLQSTLTKRIKTLIQSKEEYLHDTEAIKQFSTHVVKMVNLHDSAKSRGDGKAALEGLRKLIEIREKTAQCLCNP